MALSQGFISFSMYLINAFGLLAIALCVTA